MSDKSKLFYRIKALFFTGAITAATLRGCTYGPPPAPIAEPPQKTQSTISQIEDITPHDILITVHKDNSFNSRINTKMVKLNEKNDKI